MINLREKTFFHGTRFTFESFETGTVGTNVANPTTALGFYFTDRLEGAKRWADYKGIASRMGWEQRIMEVRLAISNPRYISPSEFAYLLKSAQKRTVEKLRKEAGAKGYDGFVIDYLGPDAQEIWCVPMCLDQISIVSTQIIQTARRTEAPVEAVQLTSLGI